MDYVNLGKTGLKVSRICLGCMTYGAPATGKPQPGSHAWALNEEESRPFFRQALDPGINFFDTANVYSAGDSEEVLGRFLKANVRREAVVIATKVNGVMRDEPNGGGLSRKAIFFELDQSLRRLGTDYVDLYQIHRWDYETPDRRDTGSAARRGEIRQGALYGALHVCLAIHQGALSRRSSRLDALCFHAESLQPALSRRRARDDPPLPVRRHRRHSLEPAGPRPTDAPLAKRKHQAPRNRPVRQQDVLANRRSRPQSRRPLRPVSEQRGVPRAQLALAWLLGKPGITAPIVGATKPHIWRTPSPPLVHLTPEEIAALEEPYTPHPVLGFS